MPSIKHGKGRRTVASTYALAPCESGAGSAGAIRAFLPKRKVVPVESAILPKSFRREAVAAGVPAAETG